MEIDIYQSNENSTKFLTVPAGTDLQNFKFPHDLDKDYTDVRLHKTIDIDADSKLIALDAPSILKQIENNGFATHRVKIN